MGVNGAEKSGLLSVDRLVLEGPSNITAHEQSASVLWFGYKVDEG